MLSKWCALRSSLFRKYLARNVFASSVNSRIQEYNNAPYHWHSNTITQHYKTKQILLLYTLHRKWCSKELPEVSEYSDLELKKIKSLFPEPRMTLNNLAAKTPEKVFEVHYKQYVAPKGVKKKTAQNLDWTCVYTFVWPEKIKFECTALSKRQAGEAAATQALYWLTINKRIDSKGHPVYDKDTISKVRSSLCEPIEVRFSENSVERIARIWEDYENGIRDIYERTAKDAKNRVVTASAQLSKDSTIDEDEFPESENSSNEELDYFTDHRGLVHPVYGKILRPPSEQTLKRRSETLKHKFQLYDDSLTPLPIDEHAHQITSTLESSKVTVLVGAAGCGKSTRVPAMILRDCGVNATIVVAEPRRVAAIGLAERVANEMGEEVGESIGYHVRLNSKPPRPPAGSVLFCTSGVLLNRLQTNPGLTGCSHVIIDEAHERDHSVIPSQSTGQTGRAIPSCAAPCDKRVAFNCALLFLPAVRCWCVLHRVTCVSETFFDMTSMNSTFNQDTQLFQQSDLSSDNDLIDHESPPQFVTQRKGATNLEVENLCKNFQAFQLSITSTLEKWFTKQDDQFARLIDDFNNVRASIKFINDSFEGIKTQTQDAVVRVIALETKSAEIQTNTSKLIELEVKFDAMEQQARQCNIEIGNLPEKRGENLPAILEDIAALVKISINKQDIVSIHRVPQAQGGTQRPKNVIVKFSTRLLRDSFLSSVRLHKGITSEKLNISGTSNKVFLNEHLTLKNKALYRRTRDAARQCGFRFVWIKHGSILVRRNETAPVFAIRTEKDLVKICPPAQ